MGEQVISKRDALDAIEDIRSRIWEVDIPSPTVPEYVEHHRQMQDLMKNCDAQMHRIENLASEKDPKWIPTSERLPDDDSMKLVTAQPKKGEPNINRAFYMDGYWHGSGSMSNVTAWMDLPEPYRGGE